MSHWKGILVWECEKCHYSFTTDGDLQFNPQIPPKEIGKWDGKCPKCESTKIKLVAEHW